ncbi:MULTISPECIES: hypothetical protein [Serratia]|uniref:hypothetical protein n=1 Tax=Serratia TaxID=613 RepID=UPI0006606819|nr:hypothetical protein [Serratia sp. 506_PEND]
MASYTNEKQEIELGLLAMKGMLADASPEDQQIVAECRQLIADMLAKYNDMGKAALTIAWFELMHKEG